MQIKKILFLLLIMPNLASANIIISEIMYDPEGTDTGREWIEVKNTSENSIDVANYKFLESGVNHKLTLIKGNSSALGTGEFAIIADNADKFLLDFPNFSGILFDSAFSLVNTGEELKIVSGAGVVTDTVTYNPEIGGKNTRNSLQLNDSVWIPGKPTPAQTNVSIAENEGSNDSGSNGDSNTSGSTSGTNSNNSAHSDPAPLTNYKPKTALSVGIGRDRLVSINTPLEFVASHNQSEEDEKPRFKWNLGDGNTESGRKINHAYEFPGVYNVILNSNNRETSAVSRSKITVFEPKVDILLKTSGEVVNIMLKNLSGKELNLGDFSLKYGNKQFKFPKDTILSNNQIINAHSKITGFVSIENMIAQLFYPNNILLTETKKENLIINSQ